MLLVFGAIACGASGFASCHSIGVVTVVHGFLGNVCCLGGVLRGRGVFEVFRTLSQGVL
jgi:hypothetical protein